MACVLCFGQTGNKEDRRACTYGYDAMLVFRLRVCVEIAVYVLRFPAVPVMMHILLSHGTLRHIEAAKCQKSFFTLIKGLSRLLCQQGSYIP
jgi:hypothetical protein